MKFTEDDVIEGVFLLKASTKDVFFNRKEKLFQITNFSGEAYEEDDDGGIFKLIATSYFDTLDQLKKVIESMKKYNRFYHLDSDILLNGKEIFCGGKWLI